MSRKLMVRAAVALVLLVGAAVLPGAALGAPGNDAFASATVIDPSSLPFSDQIDVGSATSEVAEPQYCYFTSQTVWYAITATTSGALRVSPAGSTFSDSLLNVYRQNGSGFGGLTNLGCGTFGSSVTVSVQAGSTYYIQAAKMFGGPGTLQVNVESVPPPANDDFVNAAEISSPFSGSVDTTAATIEANEPTPSCGYGQSAGTAWYAFTPSASGSYSASTPYSSFTSQVAAYSGSSLATLAQLGCQGFGNLLTFHADAGQTIYLQVGGLFGSRGSLPLNLTAAPNPVVQLNFNPNDPSLFDTVQFYDYSYDPGNNGIQSRTWNFGDGGGSTNQYPSHRYVADGTYPVTLTVTTSDGRTKSLSQQLIVKTHDVSIARVAVPQSGVVGQSRQINVALTNARYGENVEVRLYKSVVGGTWQQVGALTQWVPVRGANRTTNFAFSYTFAPEDAVLGKVTFQAVAEIQGARDAIPTDNTFISLATKVNG